LKKIVAPLELECFRTSIWDETLYKAWSAIVHSLVPNKRAIEKNLSTLCQLCDADEIVLFEKATFLVISHAHMHEHSDAHRFEKISNIVKQFKLSCGNAHAQFVSLEVKNSNFSAFIDAFTSTTYIMVVMSDPKISKSPKFSDFDLNLH
jgi:Ras-related GTP-binding protein A/B